MKSLRLVSVLLVLWSMAAQAAVVTLRPTIDASVRQFASPIADFPFVRIDTSIVSDAATIDSSFSSSNGVFPNPSATATAVHQIQLVFDLTTLPAGTIASATLFWSEADDRVSNRGGTLNRHELQGYLGEDFDLPFYDTPNQNFPIIASQVANGTLDSLIQQDVTSLIASSSVGDVSAKFVIVPKEPYTRTVFVIRTNTVDSYFIHSRLAIESLQPGLVIEVIPEADSWLLVGTAAIVGLFIQNWLSTNRVGNAAD